MAVDNGILKIITKECCRSLSFDDERQLFSFPFRPALSDLWIDMRKRVHKIDPCFHLDNFNNELHRMASLSELSIELSVNEIHDVDLMQGEMMRISLSQGYVPVSTLIKMKRGQYLDSTTGRGLSLGDRTSFKVGKEIITSEGEKLGVCKTISLLMPTAEHTAVGRVMLGSYYRKDISDSLWPLYNLAKTVNYNNATLVCKEILSMASKMGIGIMPLLNIINAPVRYGL